MTRPESIKWKLISRREIAPRSAHAACGIPGTPLMFVFGGTSKTGCGPLSEQYFSVFDYDQLSWKHYGRVSGQDSSRDDDVNADAIAISPRIGHSMIGVPDGRIIGSHHPQLHHHADQAMMMDVSCCSSRNNVDWQQQHDTHVRHSALLVFGGWTKVSSDDDEDDDDDNGDCCSELWKFNVTSGTWHNLTRVQSGSIPSARTGHSCVVINDQMIVFGGMGQSDDCLLGDTHVLDLKTLNWTRVTMDSSTMVEGVNHPFKSYSHTCVVHRKRMILFGGSAEYDCYNTMWSFDPVQLRWSKIHVQSSDEPSPRSFCAGAMVNEDQLIVFGGWNWRGTMGETWRFDFECNEWSLVQFGDDDRCDGSGDTGHGTTVTTTETTTTMGSGVDPLVEESEEAMVHAMNYRGHRHLHRDQHQHLQRQQQQRQTLANGTVQVKPVSRSYCTMATVTSTRSDSGTTRILMFGGEKYNEQSSELWELHVQSNIRLRSHLFKVFERNAFFDVDIFFAVLGQNEEEEDREDGDNSNEE